MDKTLVYISLVVLIIVVILFDYILKIRKNSNDLKPAESKKRNFFYSKGVLRIHVLIISIGLTAGVVLVILDYNRRINKTELNIHKRSYLVEKINDLEIELNEGYNSYKNSELRFLKSKLNSLGNADFSDFYFETKQKLIKEKINHLLIALLVYLLLFFGLLPLFNKSYLWIKDGFKDANLEKNKSPEISKNKAQKFYLNWRYYLILLIFLFMIFYSGCHSFIPKYYYKIGKCDKANEYWMLFNEDRYPKCISRRNSKSRYNSRFSR